MIIGVALFEGAEELDWAGPWEVLAAWSKQWPDDGVRVLTLAREPGTITCAKGLQVVPEETWESAPPLDVLVYPGGRGTRRELADEAVLDWIRGLAGDRAVRAARALRQGATPQDRDRLARALDRGLGVVLDVAAHLARALGRVETLDQVQGHVYPGGDTGGGQDVPVVDEAVVGPHLDLAAERRQQLERAPVRRRGLAVEQPGRGQDKIGRAHV